MRPLVLLTRGSPLARRQADLVSARLGVALGRPVEIRIVVTTGDKQTNWSLEKQGGKGLFTAELEEALRRGEGDIAIHSAKDLPTAMPEGLSLAGFLPREDPRDTLVRRAEISVALKALNFSKMWNGRSCVAMSTPGCAKLPKDKLMLPFLRKQD